MLFRSDCAVIISNSGRSKDLLDVADIARKKGATVIAITASGSPLAMEVAGGPHHILLAADHPEDADRYSPMVSRLLHLLIIDILTTGVALRRSRRANGYHDRATPPFTVSMPATWTRGATIIAVLAAGTRSFPWATAWTATAVVIASMTSRRRNGHAKVR
mgnify:CR=1 FL=1